MVASWPDWSLDLVLQVHQSYAPPLSAPSLSLVDMVTVALVGMTKVSPQPKSLPFLPLASRSASVKADQL